MIKTDVSEETLPVATAKLTDVWPAKTVTLAGTLAAAALLLVSVTRAPPEGAGVFNVTVADVELPATTVEGFTVTLLTDAAITPPVPVPPPLPVPAPVLPVPDPVVPEDGVPENPPLLLLGNVPQPISVESMRNELTISPMTCSRKPMLNRVLKLAKSTMASPNRRTRATSTPPPR